MTDRKSSFLQLLKCLPQTAQQRDNIKKESKPCGIYMSLPLKMLVPSFPELVKIALKGKRFFSDVIELWLHGSGES